MAEISEDIVKKIEEFFTRAGIEVGIEVGSHPEIATQYINIATPEGRLLVGSRGENLTAIEHILKRILEKETGERPRFFLDINGHRMRRIEELKEGAKQIAKKVRLYRKELVLKPMSPFERRVVHMALAEYPDITTESIGEDERRRVVIKPYP